MSILGLNFLVSSVISGAFSVSLAPAPADVAAPADTAAPTDAAAPADAAARVAALRADPPTSVGLRSVTSTETGWADTI